jgi:hypothetical protein
MGATVPVVTNLRETMKLAKTRSTFEYDERIEQRRKVEPPTPPDDINKDEKKLPKYDHMGNKIDLEI